MIFIAALFLSSSLFRRRSHINAHKHMRLPSTLKIPAQRAVSLLAAAVISTSSSFALPAIAAPLPTQVELLRLSEGLARVDQ